MLHSLTKLQNHEQFIQETTQLKKGHGTENVNDCILLLWLWNITSQIHKFS